MFSQTPNLLAVKSNKTAHDVYSFAIVFLFLQEGERERGRMHGGKDKAAVEVRVDVVDARLKVVVLRGQALNLHGHGDVWFGLGRRPQRLQGNL